MQPASSPPTPVTGPHRALSHPAARRSPAWTATTRRSRWEPTSLLENGDTLAVPLRPLLAARPDPFAQVEGAFLAHWDNAHPEGLSLVARLVPPEQLFGVVRVKPLRLDRHGSVLRLRYARGHRDTRVRFPTPVTTPRALTLALHALLQQARRQHERCRGWGTR